MRKNGGSAALLIVLALAADAGCGKRGALRPPEPRGPTPPKGVAARQIGSRIEVSFVVPEPRGPKPSQRPGLGELVRLEYGPGIRPPVDADAFRKRARTVATMTGDQLQHGKTVRIEDSTWTALEGGGVGWLLRYAVRVRDARGRASALVVAPDLVPVAPPTPPSALHAEATADGIRVVWQPPSGEGNFRYNLYRALGKEPFGDRPIDRDPLTSTDYLDTDVETGKTYRYEIRTTASDGPPYRESVSSAEIEVVAEDRFPPSAPTGLVAVQEGAGVRLFWNPNQEKDLAAYRVFRKIGDGDWSPLGAGPVREPLLFDDGVAAGQHAAYRVVAVDRAGNESPPSEPVEIDVVQDTGSRPGGEP